MFQTIPIKEISEAIQQLVNSYNEAAKNANINPLLLIPCFIFDFLCISPFEDRNEQLSQLLFLLLLCKSGFEVVRCISIEEKFRRTKAEYDIAFKDSAVNWHEGKNKYFPFIEYCLDILLFCYKELDKYRGQDAVNAIKITKTERIRDIVLNSANPISKAEIHAELSDDVGMGTIEKVLGDMVRDGIVEKCGGGRSTRYVQIERL